MTFLLSNWKYLAIGLTGLLAGWFYLEWREAEQEADLEQAAHEQTVSNYMLAATEAALADAQNKIRVAEEQAGITERIENEYQARIAAVRAEYNRRLRRAATANPGDPGAAPVSDIPGTAIGTDGTATGDGFPDAERLIATEQAIQLEELQRWIREQQAVDFGNE